jgi:hypothetical protein
MRENFTATTTSHTILGIAHITADNNSGRSPFFRHTNALAKPLALEVADGVVVGVRQEIFNFCTTQSALQGQ